MRKLSGFINPEATRMYESSHRPTQMTTVIEEEEEKHDDYTATSDITPDTGTILMDNRSITPEFALLTVDYDKVSPTTYKDIFTAPNTFEEAWNHPCEWQRAKWRDGAHKEVGKMV